MATAAIMTQGDESALERFRADARKWIHDNFPPNLKGKPVLGFLKGRGSNDPDFQIWIDRLARKGWSVPTWPVESGGAGLSPIEANVLRQELDRAGSFNPASFMAGVTMLGPTLLEYGTDAQKARHLPPIVAGAVRWCQGYSEPGAGSDLASLRTQAVDMGDHFLVNGQKIWTSGAHYADWCFCLVRTDNSRKHEGISFLLIDMASPGVEVRPITLISGDSHFCEVFLTDVAVPKDNLVGPLNGGWTVGKRLLQFERDRQGSTRVASYREADARTLAQTACDYVGTDEAGRIADPALRARIAGQAMNDHALSLTMQRLAAGARDGSGPSVVASIIKNANTRNNQSRDELLIEVLGYRGLGWDGAAFAASELDSTRNWLTNKAQSIYGGSSEIQNNIIAKRVLGLPDGA